MEKPGGFIFKPLGIERSEKISVSRGKYNMKFGFD